MHKTWPNPWVNHLGVRTRSSTAFPSWGIIRPLVTVRRVLIDSVCHKGRRGPWMWAEWVVMWASCDWDLANHVLNSIWLALGGPLGPSVAPKWVCWIFRSQLCICHLIRRHDDTCHDKLQEVVPLDWLYTPITIIFLARVLQFSRQFQNKVAWKGSHDPRTRMLPVLAILLIWGLLHWVPFPSA